MNVQERPKPKNNLNVKTLMHLDEALDRDLSWRKKEFSTIKILAESAHGSSKEVLMKAAIALMYSHWEGHVKYCAMVYLNYIKKLGIPLSRLNQNFLEIAIGSAFDRDNFKLSSWENQSKICNFITNCEGNFSVKEEFVIDTKSNLKSYVYVNILNQLGLKSTYIETREKFIDSTLLQLRNEISHGDKVDIVVLREDFELIKDSLFEMIEEFHNLIKNSASNKSYLKKENA